MATKKPITQREMVEQLWYAMIGTNGDGAIKQLKVLVEEFEEYRRTRSDTCPLRREKNRVAILPGQWVMFAVALAALATTWIVFGIRG